MQKKGHFFVIWIYLLIINLIKISNYEDIASLDWKFFLSLTGVAICGYFLAKLFNERCN